MFEKRFAAVLAQPFLVNGGANGVIIVPDTTLFKVKQVVTVASNTQPILDSLEVKMVIAPTTLIVGPTKSNFNTTVNLSAYKVADHASISANEQQRPLVPADGLARALFEEEPIVAQRSI